MTRFNTIIYDLLISHLSVIGLFHVIGDVLVNDVLRTWEVAQRFLLPVLRYEDVLVLHYWVLNAGAGEVLYSSCYFGETIVAVAEPIIAGALLLGFLDDWLLRGALDAGLGATVLAA